MITSGNSICLIGIYPIQSCSHTGCLRQFYDAAFGFWSAEPDSQIKRPRYLNKISTTSMKDSLDYFRITRIIRRSVCSLQYQEEKVTSPLIDPVTLSYFTLRLNITHETVHVSSKYVFVCTYKGLLWIFHTSDSKGIIILHSKIVWSAWKGRNFFPCFKIYEL